MIKVNDFIVIGRQHWLVVMIINQSLKNERYVCFRDGKRKIIDKSELDAP